ncbi:hypothetical protein U0070_008246, partial [Myodes glareolus]
MQMKPGSERSSSLSTRGRRPTASCVTSASTAQLACPVKKLRPPTLSEDKWPDKKQKLQAAGIVVAIQEFMESLRFGGKEVNCEYFWPQTPSIRGNGKPKQHVRLYLEKTCRHLRKTLLCTYRGGCNEKQTLGGLKRDGAEGAAIAHQRPCHCSPASGDDLFEPRTFHLVGFGLEEPNHIHIDEVSAGNLPGQREAAFYPPPSTSSLEVQGAKTPWTEVDMFLYFLVIKLWHSLGRDFTEPHCINEKSCEQHQVIGSKLLREKSKPPVRPKVPKGLHGTLVLSCIRCAELGDRICRVKPVNLYSLSAKADTVHARHGKYKAMGEGGEKESKRPAKPMMAEKLPRKDQYLEAKRKKTRNHASPSKVAEPPVGPTSSPFTSEAVAAFQGFSSSFRVPEPEAPSSLGNVTERVQAQWCARRCTDGLWKSRKLDSFQFIRTILCTGRTEAQMGALPSKCGQPPSQQPLGNLSGMNPQGGREAPQSDSELTAEEMKAARTRADWHPDLVLLEIVSQGKLAGICGTETDALKPETEKGQDWIVPQGESQNIENSQTNETSIKPLLGTDLGVNVPSVCLQRQLSVSGLGGVLSSAAFFEITCLLRCLPLGQRMPQCRVDNALEPKVYGEIERDDTEPSIPTPTFQEIVARTT